MCKEEGSKKNYTKKEKSKSKGSIREGSSHSLTICMYMYVGMTTVFFFFLDFAVFQRFEAKLKHEMNSAPQTALENIYKRP